MTRQIKTLTLIALIASSLALTGCGEESTLLAPQPAVLDTAPPVPPAGLVATAGKVDVQLTWEANVLDDDFAGYMVYRVVWGNPYPMLTLPIQSTTWVDTHPVEGACTYAVSALDWSGNESAWSAVNYVDDSEPRRPLREEPLP